MLVISHSHNADAFWPNKVWSKLAFQRLIFCQTVSDNIKMIKPASIYFTDRLPDPASRQFKLSHYYIVIQLEDLNRMVLENSLSQ